MTTARCRPAGASPSAPRIPRPSAAATKSPPAPVLSYGWAEYADRNAETFNANENITIKHRPNLESFLALNYQNNQMDPASSDSSRACRDSATSSTTVSPRLSTCMATTALPPASAARPSTTATGSGSGESYSKRLSSWATSRSAGRPLWTMKTKTPPAAGVLDRHQRIARAQGHPSPVPESTRWVIPCNDYRHRARRRAHLRQRRGLPVIPHGRNDRDPARPHQHPASQRGRPSSSATRCDSSHTSSFDSDQRQRLHLGSTSYNLSVFTGAQSVDNNAPPEALAETYRLVGGVDVTWRWLRAGAEYENYDSNFTQ